MAMILAPIAAAPGFAQADPAPNPFSTISPAAEGQFGKSNFSFRINEIIGQDGSRQKRRSIIAGVDVAPGTTVGFGLFDSGAKAKGRGPDPRLDGLSKRSRKAALGMSFRF
jgi:hypothetical protein